MKGHVWRTPSLSIERVEVDRGTRLSGHSHEVPQLSFVMSGEIVVGARQKLSAGSIRVSPAGDELDLTFETEARCCVVLFDSDPLGVAFPAGTERKILREERSEKLARELAALLGQPGTSSTDLEVLALELTAEVHACRPVGDARRRWLRRLRDRMRDEPFSSLSARELAGETGHHPVYVARAFRKVYGIGLTEFGRVVRAENARRLLSETARPISEIALTAGFSDQSHLSRSMKRYFGLTPGQIRSGASGARVASVQDGLVLIP